MTAEGGGYFVHRQSGADEGLRYWFRLADGRDYPDPASRWQPDGVHGPSAVFFPESHVWSDAGWQGVLREDLVIYELHVGTFTPEGTLDAMVPRLAELRSLGITAVELMPVAQFPGDRNWGYDAVYPYAAQNSYGGPRALQRLVDAAHCAGLGVILDVVYNHLGPEENYLANYGPYFTDRYRTPWGHAVNYDGPHSDAVRHYVIDNARMWVRDFHVDGLRLDAVQAIYDFSAYHILTEIQAAVQREAARDARLVHVIAESDQNDVRLVRARERGGMGLDGVWSDDFHHSVHALLTGECDGYYADFGRPSQLAKAYCDVFVYDGCYSPFRCRRHGSRVGTIDRTRFVVCIQNHDQVGNRAQGDRFSTILPPAAGRLACGLLLLSPCVPLLFMGEEYGEERPFPFFSSFGDPALIEAVRRGRREEFAALAFQWKTAIPDPQAVETFAAAKLGWAWPEGSTHARLRQLYQDLLAAGASGRHSATAGILPRVLTAECDADECLMQDVASGHVASGHPERSEGSLGSPQILRFARNDRALLLLQRGGEDGLLAVANLTSIVVDMPALELGGRELLLSTEDARYGGVRKVLPSPFGRGAGGEGGVGERFGSRTCVHSEASSIRNATRPHPSPLPEGEGTGLHPYELLIFGSKGERP